MSSPLVSVVMTAYNSARFIEESIDSIIKQTFKDFEFIIIDDYSTDDTLSIIKKMLINFDNSYKIIENKNNIGTAASRNIANQVAVGKFIAVADSDDISLPIRLEEEVNFLKQEKSFDVCGSPMIVMDEEGKDTGLIYSCPFDIRSIKKWMFLYTKNPILHPTSIYSKDAFFEVSGYDEDILWCHDYDLWLKMMKHQKKMHNLRNPLVKYRIVKDGLTFKSSLQDRRIRELLFIICRSGLLESEWDEKKNGKYKFEYIERNHDE